MSDAEVHTKELKIADLMEKKGAIQLDGELTLYDQLAIITHYYHNEKTKFDKTYKTDALNNIKKILEVKYPETTQKGTLKDVAGQYGLFSDVFNVPYP